MGGWGIYNLLAMSIVVNGKKKNSLYAISASYFFSVQYHVNAK
jgi:hypothetical protein